MGHGRIGQPVEIGFGPLGFTAVDDAVSEQKNLQPLFGFSGAT